MNPAPAMLPTCVSVKGWRKLRSRDDLSVSPAPTDRLSSADTGMTAGACDMNKAEKTIRDLLALADIEVNGASRRDLRGNSSQFYQRVLSGGPLGLGEACMWTGYGTARPSTI